MFKKKPKVGYQKRPIKKSGKKESAIHQLFLAPKKKMPLPEKIVKFIIYFALRMVIRPKKWKHPKKNVEIINRTYERIMSSDFVYIPSSIAFYLIMAFLPILSIIALLYLIPGIGIWLEDNRIHGVGKLKSGVVKYDAVTDILGKFIPGADSIFYNIKQAMSGANRTVASVATITSLLVSTWIASNGFSKLIYTQSHIYEHKYLGGYWMNKLKGMFMVFAFTLFLIIALVMNVAVSTWIATFDLPLVWKTTILYSFLVPSMFVGLFMGFIVLYRFSPRYKIKIRHIIPGAMITTIPTFAFFILFGAITAYWNYGAYGVLGAIMFIGMASLIITYFIFVGVVANAAYYKTFIGDKVESKWTISKK